MKIKKIKYNNHIVLGNLELDFVNPTTNMPYETIVFLGENGTGKTTILRTISDFLNWVSFKPFAYFEYEADGVSYKAEPTDKVLNACFFDRTNLVDGTTQFVRTDKQNNPLNIPNDRQDPRSYSCVVSKARADYKTDKITSSKTSRLDSEKHEDDSADNYTSLKQMLVDIANQDNQEFVDFNISTGQNFSAFEPSSRLYRFKSAFNNFFPQMKFKKVIDTAGEKLVLFEKNGKEISIDDLSTGEKQIVFRGAYLLKNSGNMDDGTAFVDEPELSMHPAWQKKILQYFKDLYKEPGTGRQKAQMFFASHSDSVVIDAISDRQKTIVIVLKENNGVIEAKHITAPIVLPSVTNAEINYHAFDLYSVDFHIALYGYLQTLTGNNRVADMDSYICSHALFDSVVHSKPTTHGTTTYNCLSTAIRNNIDHPDNGNSYTEEELATSTELLIKLIADWKANNP